MTELSKSLKSPCSPKSINTPSSRNRRVGTKNRRQTSDVGIQNKTMKLVDTHCHIHSSDYGLPIHEVLERAAAASVEAMVCVGTDLDDSQLAVKFVADHESCVASIGIHPHGAKRYAGDPKLRNDLAMLITKPKVVAVGECGLDYYYEHSPRDDQKAILQLQIELALEYDKPLIFHVRDAFVDFWKIFDRYRDLRGVVHSFTAGPDELQQVLDRDLYVGLNGIMTFSKDPRHEGVIKTIPDDHLILETDAPFLTPVPRRGTMNEPANVSLVCEYLAHVRGISSESLAEQTTNNAQRLFSI